MESDEMTCDEMKIETADVKKTGTLDRPAQILKKKQNDQRKTETKQVDRVAETKINQSVLFQMSGFWILAGD